MSFPEFYIILVPNSYPSSLVIQGAPQGGLGGIKRGRDPRVIQIYRERFVPRTVVQRKMFMFQLISCNKTLEYLLQEIALTGKLQF